MDGDLSAARALSRPAAPGAARDGSSFDESIRHAVTALAHAATCCSGESAGAAPPADRPSTGTEHGRGRAVPGHTSFLLPDVTVVDPDRQRLEHMDVVVADGRVVSVQPVGLRIPSADVQVLDRYQGHFVLPGLIDMHAHLPPDNVLDLGGVFALLHLAHGVTSVRDAGDVDGTAVAGVRRGIAEGRYNGPRLFCAGLFITAGPPRWKNSIVMRSPDEADAIARRLRSEGYHSMKLYENLTAPMINALVDAAARHGLRVLGHVPARLAYETARMPDAQHFYGVPPPETLKQPHLFNRGADWEYVTPERLLTIVRTSIEHGLANTPTVVVSGKLLEYERYGEAVHEPGYRALPRLYRDVVWNPALGLPAYRGLVRDDFERLRDAFGKKLALVKLLFDGGARLHLGTDVQQPFVVPGASLLEEMQLFERAGIRPGAVWHLATRGAAAYLEMSDLGEVRAGALADLLVCARDPTVALTNHATLRAVVSRGSLMDKAALDARLAEEQKRHEGFFAERVAPVVARLHMWRIARTFVD